MRSVHSWEGDNSFKMVMYGPGPDGRVPEMEIVAKRK